MMKKLLLADDSITIQKVVGIIFSTEEYQLEMTDDGDSAFKKALEDIPDLVIADISMPGKDGFELCRAIKSEPSLSNTSVLLLPGAFDHFDEIKAGEVCADGWLTKPFESQALLDKVSQLLAAEPVRMAGVAAGDLESSPEEGQEELVKGGENSSINGAVLGFEDVADLQSPTEEIEDESPDDIWDAVSFAEEDLQKQSETASTDTTDEISFAADVIDPSAVADVDVEPATDEQVLSAFTAEADEVDPPVAGSDNDFVAEAAETSGAEELQAEPFAAVDLAEEEMVPEITDQVEAVADIVAQAPREEAEVVDFSSFSEAEDESLADVTEEAAYFVPAVEDDEPLELLDELDEGSGGISEESDLSVAAEEDNPLELMGSDLAEQSAEVNLAGEESSGSFVAEADDEEFIMELQEEEELTDLEPVTEEITAPEASDVPFGETVNGASSAADEILDLSEDDVVEFEPLGESLEETAVADEVEPFVVEEPEAEFEPVDEAADLVEEKTELVEEETELVEEETELVEEETELVEEETELVEEEAELGEEEAELGEEEAELGEEDLEPLSTVVEDDNFYFDATAEDDTDVAAATAGAVGLAAAGFGSTAVAESATAQVEQQLRELSEDELKEVVSKVAGPMIEKMAGEMLEKVAWEVVPDLAEAMISEEIRKIKEGA